MIKSAQVSMKPKANNTNYWDYTVSFHDEHGAVIACEQGETKTVSEVWGKVGGLFNGIAPDLSGAGGAVRITKVPEQTKQHVTDVEDMSRDDIVDLLVSARYEEDFDERLHEVLASVYNKGYANGYKTGEEETREDEQMRRDKAIIRSGAEQDHREREVRRKLYVALDDMTEALRILG